MNKKLLSSAICSSLLVFSMAGHAADKADDEDASKNQTTEMTAEEQGAPYTGAREAYKVSSKNDEKTKISGWSAKDHVLGKKVYNDKDDKIGEINDLVLSEKGEVTHYIIGVGGFLGMGEKNVAIPLDQLSLKDQKDDDDDKKDVDFVLKGASKDDLKDMPEVEVEDDKS